MTTDIDEAVARYREAALAYQEARDERDAASQRFAQAGTVLTNCQLALNSARRKLIEVAEGDGSKEDR